jgi:hypothetical protein
MGGDECQKIIIFNRTTSRLCCVIAELLLSRSWHLLCAFDSHRVSMRFGKLSIFILAIGIFWIADSIFLNII